MQTLTLSIDDPETIKAIEELARQVNKAPQQYLTDLIQIDIQSARPFREILAPFRAGFQQSGLTEDEFDSLIEQELQAVRRENLSQSNGNGDA
ncbi:MAG: hypothetical protein ACKV2V_18480 [Blastocatellia bacterium]